MKKKSAVIIGVSSVLLIAIGSIIIYMLSSKKEEPIYRVGQIEMREIDVSSKIPGRIEWIAFDEGDYVGEGCELFKLTDREMKAKYSQAEGAVETAQAQLRMVVAGARKEEIEMARRAYDAAVSQFELAEKTFERMKSLWEDKLLSTQDYDVSKQKYQASKAQMEASKAQLDMAIAGARIEQKDMAHGQLTRAKQSLEEVSAYLDESIIKSPISGIIAKKYVSSGEIAAAGYPIISLIDPNDVWLELNLPASELEMVKIGDVLEGRIDGLGVVEKFKIINFSAMSDFANWRSTSDKQTFDIRSFTVKLKPVNKSIESLRPGMTVRLRIDKKSA